MQDRRFDGTGSVRQHGNTWYGRWYIDGKRVERSLGPVRKPGTREGLTRAQAETKLRDLMAKTEPAPAGGTATVTHAGAALVERMQDMGRSRGSWEAVESHFRVHIEPHPIGKMTMDRVTEDDVESLVRALKRKGLAPKSIRNIASSLHSAFELGRKKKWAKENPVEFADLPVVERNDDIRYLTMAELDRVVTVGLDKSNGGGWLAWRAMERPLYLTAAQTGMRMGELRALRWRDVDWLAGRIRIVKNRTRGVTKNPKGKKSRSVPVTPALLAELEAHFKRTAFQADDDLVFGHPELGTEADRSKVLKRWKAACRRAGVRVVRFHDLRHTFGTHLASKGAPVRALQEWGGWEDPATAKRYQDFAPSGNDVAFFTAAFGGELPAADPPNTPPHGEQVGTSENDSNGAVEPNH